MNFVLFRDIHPAIARHSARNPKIANRFTATRKHGHEFSHMVFSKVNGKTFDGNFVERVMRCSVFVIVVVQSLFFALGGIRDNLFNGRVVMPDEEYLQSWFYDTKLGESETHSDRMDTIGKCWGTFIATIALLKIAVALCECRHSNLGPTGLHIR
jgi:hypothetical protein